MVFLACTSKLMGAEGMQALCAANSELCDHFVDQPNGGIENNWPTYKLPTSVPFTTYLRLESGLCAFAKSECGNSDFVRCPGRDSSGPLVKMESYDVGVKLLAEICRGLDLENAQTGKQLQ